MNGSKRTGRKVIQLPHVHVVGAERKMRLLEEAMKGWMDSKWWGNKKPVTNATGKKVQLACLLSKHGLLKLAAPCPVEPIKI